MTRVTANAPDPRTWRWALVAIRTYFGIVYFNNGLAKVFEFHTVQIGPWSSSLIDRQDSHNILIALNRDPNHGIGIARDVANNLVLPHWDVFQWVVAFGELGVGLGLILGILPRLAALGGIAMAWPLFIWSFGFSTWMFDYLFEPVVLTVLALTPGLPGLGRYLPFGYGRVGTATAMPSSVVAGDAPAAQSTAERVRP